MNAITSTVLACLVLTACGGSTPVDDVADVRTCFNAYFAALRNGNGAAASELVAQPTVAYYDSMLMLARDADSSRVAELPLMDRITVLGMRLRGTPQDLGAMNGRSALAFAVDQGMMATMGSDGVDLGTIGVDGDVARAPLLMHGFPTPASFVFIRETGQWRIDITPLFELSRMALQHLAADRGADALLMELIAGDPAAQLPDSTWHPRH